MYSESDIDNAVTAGAISAEAAAALRGHVARTNAAPAVDEESFRLLTGFNDIFVSIAIALLLVALTQIGTSIAYWLGGALVAAGSWLLAEYFTRRRRMALPSILLLLSFVGGVAGTLIGLIETVVPHIDGRPGALAAAGVALGSAAAAWLHWRRFMVPITVTTGAAAIVGLGIALVVAAIPDVRTAVWPLLLIGGLGVFAVAMRWDMSDRERRTRRSDVAFWLHLAAAPMIAHSTFQMLGVFDRSAMNVGIAIAVLGLYLAFAFVALAIDRRALLVSGLVYVLYAMYALIRTTGAVELGYAFSALVIGSVLLTLSAFWHPMRARVIAMLGSTGTRLPPVHALA